MRKLLLSAILLVSGSSCFAVDVIVTKNAEKIDGKVTEVSSKEIRYKKASNPDGPVYVIETDKVSTVVYENGEVDVLQAATSPQVQQEVQVSQIQQQKKKVGKMYMSRVRRPDGKKRLAYHNADNSVIMGDAELDELLQDCPSAYKHWKMALTYASNPFGAPSVFKSIRNALKTYNEECAEE